MQCSKGWIAVFLIGLVTAVMVRDGQADKTPEIFPLDKVRRGQKGYGFTTFHGTTPERFEFEVLGVAKNMLPKMDIILVQSDDPKFSTTGFWRGMSGSPLFIDGKLACAFAYNWRFNKVALGGCTPIEYMLKEGFVPQRRTIDSLGNDGVRLKAPGKGTLPARTQARRTGKRPAPIAQATVEDWLRVAPGRTVQSALDALGEPRKPWLASAPLPPAPHRLSTSSSDDGLVASSVPLAMSGFSTEAMEHARTLLDDFPVEPMRAGGSGNPREGPQAFQLGGSLSVLITRGDLSTAATGTVSYVDGPRVLGFGHPLFQIGEFYAPVSGAEVHTIIPSAMSAFVMASPMRELGSLVQDRQSTIMADTRLETRMIPFDLYIESEGGKGNAARSEFHTDVINNRFLTAPFAGLTALSAISYYLPDRDFATVHMESTVYVRGFEPLHFVDYLHSEDGAGSVIGGARGLRALVPLLNNPFAPVDIERVELRARLRYEINYGKIETLRLATAELPPGKRSYIEVTMSTYNHERIVQKVPFDVPASLAGSMVRLEVTSGDSAPIDYAPPRNLAELMSVLGRLLPGNVIAVTLYTADEGVAIDGKLIRDLPASALDRLSPGSASQRAEVYHPMARSLSPSRRVISGSESIFVKIADK